MSAHHRSPRNRAPALAFSAISPVLRSRPGNGPRSRLKATAAAAVIVGMGIPDLVLDSAESEDDSDMTAVTSRAELARALAAKKAQHPCLMIVSGANSVGRLYKLNGEMVVGRATDAHIHLDEDGISRHHARFRVREDGSVELLDLRSRNGTCVNGDRFEQTILRDGDRVQIGGTTILKFSYQDEVEEQLQKNLYESATRDALTGVLNKRALTEALGREHAFAIRHERPLSAALFDIDHFKRVNDTYGHAAGDAVLSQAASRVRSTLRAEDVFARYGGEEFAAVMRDTPAAAAMQCMERVRRAVEAAPFVFESTAIPVTVSIGVATLTAGRHPSPGSLLEDADRALYVAKRTGRNRVQFGEGGAPAPDMPPRSSR